MPIVACSSGSTNAKSTPEPSSNNGSSSSAVREITKAEAESIVRRYVNSSNFASLEYAGRRKRAFCLKDRYQQAKSSSISDVAVLSIGEVEGKKTDDGYEFTVKGRFATYDSYGAAKGTDKFTATIEIDKWGIYPHVKFNVWKYVIEFY